jgi:hypothetical protein
MVEKEEGKGGLSIHKSTFIVKNNKKIDEVYKREKKVSYLNGLNTLTPCNRKSEKEPMVSLAGVSIVIQVPYVLLS